MAHNTTTINLCQLKFLTINQVNYTKHQQKQKKETTETLPACECLEQSQYNLLHKMRAFEKGG